MLEAEYLVVALTALRGPPSPSPKFLFELSGPFHGYRLILRVERHAKELLADEQGFKQIRSINDMLGDTPRILVGCSAERDVS